MTGEYATTPDPRDRRDKFEGSLEFGTHTFVGQAIYAKDPAAALYDRREAVLRDERQRARRKIPARSQNLE